MSTKNGAVIQNILLFVDLEWKVIYVGSAENADLDQVLDTVLVGPVPAGKHMFVFQVKQAIAFTFSRYFLRKQLFTFWGM